MSPASALPDAIQWHEGLLLAPQHFQQLDKRQEQMLAYHLRMVQPFHWGVRKLEFDRTLLAKGKLRLLQLEAIMKDGLVVRHAPDAASVELDLALAPYPEQLERGDLEIHLAVLGSGQYDAGSGASGRFLSSSGGLTRDEFAEGVPAVEIPRVRPNILLLAKEAGDKPADRYESIPLVTIKRENEVHALGDFVPPLLCVCHSDRKGDGPGSVLWDKCSELYDRLWRKTRYRAEQQRKLAESRVESDRIAALQAGAELHSAVAGLPVFEAVLHTESVHPYALYLALCSLLGPIALLSGKLEPPSPPAYQHDDPWRATFDALLRRLNAMLDTISEAYVEKRFDDRNGRFALTIEKAWLQEEEKDTKPVLVIGLRGRSEHDLAEWLESSLIGSASVIDSLHPKRIKGAPRKRIVQSKDGPPASAGVTFFEIDASRDGGFVRAGEPLHIYNPSSDAEQRRPAAIVLYAKAPASTAQPPAALPGARK